MSDIVIRVEGLSKQYQIGQLHRHNDTLRDALMDGINRLRRRSRREDIAVKSTSFWALSDVSFKIKQGEVVGIIGRNGAGKSTLLKILSRITEPSRGMAIINGRVGSLLEVGTGFHPELTGRENIYMSGAILGMQRAEISRQFDEIVAFAELEKFIDTPVKRYSSGMYVRLAFAVAAHLEPEILLIDEVLAVGDSAFQKKCLGKMSEVATKGRTVLFVSHNLVTIRKLCPRTILLSDGSIGGDGRTSQVIDSYMQGSRNSENLGEAWGINNEVIRNQNNDKITITDIQLSQPGGELFPRAGLDGGLRIQISYDAHQKIKVPGFIVGIWSTAGAELCRVSNNPISGYNISSIAGKGKIDLTFDKLPFTGGRYIISLGVARAKVEWLARLDEIAWFDVAVGDPYGSGQPMDNNRGYLILSHRWQHSQ